MSRISIKVSGEQDVPVAQALRYYSLGDVNVLAGHNCNPGDVAIDLREEWREKRLLVNSTHLCMLDCGGIDLSTIKLKEDLFATFEGGTKWTE